MHCAVDDVKTDNTVSSHQPQWNDTDIIYTVQQSRQTKTFHKTNTTNADVLKHMSKE